MSLDIYQEYQECIAIYNNNNNDTILSECFENEYEYEYTYVLLATVDVPIPAQNVSSSGAVVERSVCVCFGVNEKGELSYEVFDDENHEIVNMQVHDSNRYGLKRANASSSIAAAASKNGGDHEDILSTWNDNLLIIFCIIMFILYIIVKMMFNDIDTSSEESVSSL